MNTPVKEVEYDVIVAGYGAAGGAAALTAHDEGARVLLIDKNKPAGGNSLVSSAMQIYPVDPKQGPQFAEYLHEVAYGTTPKDVIDQFVEWLFTNPAWYESLGGELEVYDYKTADPSLSYYIPDLTFTGIAASRGLRLHLLRMKQTETVPEPTGGARIWHLIDRNIRRRDIDVWLGAPLLEVVKDEHGAVRGVIVERNGERTFCRARRGVVLTCGGFEYSDELKLQYLQAKPIGALGNPSNTGDGIPIAIQVGADLWHMDAEASTLGFRPPGWDAGFALTVRNPGFLYVDKHGQRFVNEARLEAHNAGVITAAFDYQTYDFTRIPSYLIMDGENAHGKALGMSIFSYNVVVKGYAWSADNSKEIAAGWIKEARSLDELAAIIGTDVATITETLGRFNTGARLGLDSDFGRPPETLKPLLPPYYVMELRPLMYNTQGGPRRDKEARVIDPSGNPIPRLYAAGEYGSIWGFRYQTSTNFSEAIIFGRIAGQNAAREKAE